VNVRPLRAVVIAILCWFAIEAAVPRASAEDGRSLALQSVTIGGHGTELALRFDRPINHERSWLWVMHDGRIVATVHFRLESAPNILFARIQTPAPGTYIARWSTCPEGRDDERYEGEFPFTVTPLAASAPLDHG
jgi:hypothetical protein